MLQLVLQLLREFMNKIIILEILFTSLYDIQIKYYNNKPEDINLQLLIILNNKLQKYINNDFLLEFEKI